MVMAFDCFSFRETIQTREIASRFWADKRVWAEKGFGRK
jgi:hypothetical protein